MTSRSVSRSVQQLDWGTAFQHQAPADAAALRALTRGGSTPISRLLLAQMILEKACKAKILRDGVMTFEDIAGTHRAVDVVPQTLRSRARQTVKDPERLVAALRALEGMSPAAAGKGNPNLEYSWKDRGKIKIPALNLTKAQEWFESDFGQTLLDFCVELAEHPL